MITDEMIEAAVDYLRDSADSCSKKRAERLYLDEYTRALKSLIMSEHLAETLGAQERYAYSDLRYRNHLEALKLAIWEDEKGRFLRDAAAVKIEVWRSQRANARAEGKAYA